MAAAGGSLYSGCWQRQSLHTVTANCRCQQLLITKKWIQDIANLKFSNCLIGLQWKFLNSQNLFLKKKNIRLPTKSEGLPARFVQTLQKDIGKEFIQNILQAK